MARRGENIRRRKDGRWEARVICGYGPDGRAKYRSVYGKTYQEVREKRTALAAAPARETAPAAGRVLVGDLLLEWLEARRDAVKASTYARYSNLLRQHILPELGGYAVSALTTETVDAFLRRKLRAGRLDGGGGLSPKTVADIRSVLLLGLEYGKARRCPCGVDAVPFSPRNRQPTIRVLSRTEQARLEQAIFLTPEPLELGILISLYGGLRIGEVCALQWGDIHFESGTVEVRKTMQRIQNLDPDRPGKTRVLIDRPKTESSNRVIPLPAFVLRLLREHRGKPEDYVLTGTRAYLEPRLCLGRYQKVLRQAGLEPFTFHTLRHTFATRCVESGFDPKSLSEILGHANVGTTLQRYVHPSMEAKRAQMERLEPLSIRGQNSGQ